MATEVRIIADMIDSGEISKQAGGQRDKIPEPVKTMRSFMDAILKTLSAGPNVTFSPLEPEGDNVRFRLEGAKPQLLFDISVATTINAFVECEVGRKFRFAVFQLYLVGPPDEAYWRRLQEYGKIFKDDTSRKYHLAVEQLVHRNVNPIIAGWFAAAKPEGHYERIVQFDDKETEPGSRFDFYCPTGSMQSYKPIQWKPTPAVGPMWDFEGNREFLTDAWKNAQLDDCYKKIIDYYEGLGDSLFSYPRPNGNTPIKVPLYVLPRWTSPPKLSTEARRPLPLYAAPRWEHPSETALKMALDAKINPVPFRPTKLQKSFWDFYNDLKKKKPPSNDGNIFRLVDFHLDGTDLHLDFELEKFSHSVMCQYILEHELVASLQMDSSERPKKLDLRDRVAADANMIQNFLHEYVVRVGINNLILLRADRQTYVPMVKKRGSLSMGPFQLPLLDCVSSCIFEVATQPREDFKPLHTVLREIYEELFGNEEVAQEISKDDPYFFYKDDSICDLVELIKAGSATFEVTGFCIDLVRIVPEITTVLVVRDETYYKDNQHRFKQNPEFINTSKFTVPSDLKDAEAYLRTDVISHPDSIPGENGFDPWKWTLPGGFSFYQGMRRAVKNGLLSD